MAGRESPGAAQVQVCKEQIVTGVLGVPWGEGRTLRPTGARGLSPGQGSGLAASRSVLGSPRSPSKRPPSPVRP